MQDPDRLLAHRAFRASVFVSECVIPTPKCSHFTRIMPATENKPAKHTLHKHYKTARGTHFKTEECTGSSVLRWSFALALGEERRDARRPFGTNLNKLVFCV